jgi:hypothetical protein
MDKKLQIVQRLYSGNEPSVNDLIESNESLASEANAMGEIKTLLDSREQLRPDPLVLDRITAQAGSAWQEKHATIPANVTPIRQPARHARIYALRMAVAACAVFVVVAVGLWTLGQEDPLTPVLSESEGLHSLDDGARQAFAEEAGPSRSSELGDMDASLMSAKAVADSIPSWSDSEDIDMMRRRVQSLRRASSPLNWDDSIVPLEMMPLGGSTSGLQQASATRNGNQ